MLELLQTSLPTSSFYLLVIRNQNSRKAKKRKQKQRIIKKYCSANGVISGYEYMKLNLFNFLTLLLYQTSRRLTNCIIGIPMWVYICSSPVLGCDVSSCWFCWFIKTLKHIISLAVESYSTTILKIFAGL